MANENDKNWYVVYTNPNAEKKLLLAVSKLNLTAYLPLREEIKQWSDRRKKITVPVFKSYLFIHLDLAGIHTVKALPACVDFIRFGGYPTIMPDAEMQLLKAVMAASNSAQTRPTHLVKGDRVKLFKGTLAGYEGVLCEDPQGKKVAIEISKLNMSLMLDVPLEHMVKINRAPAGSDLSFCI